MWKINDQYKYTMQYDIEKSETYTWAIQEPYTT